MIAGRYEQQENSQDREKVQMKTSLWATMAKITPKQVEQFREYKMQQEISKLRQENL